VRSISSRGNNPHQLWYRSGVAIDTNGNIVVHDGCYNGRVKVFHLNDGSLIKSMCQKGSGDGEHSGSCSLDFDDECNLIVSDGNNHRIQVLRYRDGQHLRNIGCYGVFPPPPYPPSPPKKNLTRHLQVDDDDDNALALGGVHARVVCMCAAVRAPP